MQIGRKNVAMYICFAAILIITAVALLAYNNAMSRELSATTCQTIEQLMGQKKLTFLSHMEGEARALAILSDVAEDMRIYEKSDNELLSFLVQAKKDANFYYVAYSDLGGATLLSDGSRIDISDRDYYRAGLEGKSTISDPLISKADGSTIVVFATPVTENGVIKGVMSAAYITSNLSKLFFASYSGEGFGYICDANGTVITRASLQTNGVKADMLEYLADAQTLKHDNYNTIVANMKAGLSGHAIYLKNGGKRLLHYAPVGINGWYIFMTVADEVISAQGNYLMKLTMMLTATILLVFIGLIAYLVISQSKYSLMLYKKAYYNDLTQAPNMAKFRETATVLLKGSTMQYGAMRISIEGLDFLNEIFGYATGDRIIKAAAEAMQEMCSQSECFAHIHADRFIALLNCENFTGLEKRQMQFEELFSKRIEGLVNYKVKFAVGLYIVEPGETDIYAIIEKANFAHHAAKKNDRFEDKVQKYDAKLKDALTLEREVESKMVEALAQREFTMFLQPKYRLANDSLQGAEALARWWVNGKYIMYPADFIPIFEKNGFVVQLDLYMFEEACRFLRKLIDDKKGHIVISTNFSRLHLLKGGFVSKLCAITDKYDVPRQYLEVEITESSMVGNEGVLKSMLAELHEAGFTLSMDDFGSGYSSLGLLKEIPIDTVKIDRSFFETSKESEREHIIIESVINMAKKLQIHTVAEGVETLEHIEFLKELGCEIVQGYYFAKPMPFNEFRDLYFK